MISQATFLHSIFSKNSSVMLTEFYDYYNLLSNDLQLKDIP